MNQAPEQRSAEHALHDSSNGHSYNQVFEIVEKKKVSSSLAEHYPCSFYLKTPGLVKRTSRVQRTFRGRNINLGAHHSVSIWPFDTSIPVTQRRIGYIQ
jgi:hypothetical protein